MSEKNDPREWVKGMSLDEALRDGPAPSTSVDKTCIDWRLIAIVAGVSLIGGVIGGMLVGGATSASADAPSDVKRQLDDLRDYVDERLRDR